MSNKLSFELVQPSEFEDYYYNVYHNGDYVCELIYDGKQHEFMIGYFGDWLLGNQILIDLGNMVEELNASTKADKLFGFL